MSDKSPTTTDPAAGLAAAKLAVMAEVPYLKKSKAQGLHYTFACERELLRRLHPVLVRHGLAFTLLRTQLLYHEQYQSSQGKPMNRVVLAVQYRLTHAATGQSEEIEAAGEGSDFGDKATSKAMTSALKYALRQTFLIETGDDPDRTPSEVQQRATHAAATQQAAANGQNGAAEQPARIDREQFEFLSRLLRKAEITNDRGEPDFRGIAAHFRVKRISQLTQQQFKEAVRMVDHEDARIIPAAAPEAAHA